MIASSLVHLINKIKYGLIAFLLSYFFLGCFCNAADDLLWQIMEPSYRADLTINMGENVNTVGNNVLKGSTEISGDGIKTSPSLVVKVTRFLLSILIALSVTMILYNGMIFIIQTGQGKEGQDLTKNIVYIVVGILISLFSVVIITILQSVPKTLDAELSNGGGTKSDEEIVTGEGMSWKDVWDKVSGKKYEVTVHYIYTGGRVAAGTSINGGYSNKSGYSIKSPDIQYYTANPDTVKGTITRSNVDVTVIYTPNTDGNNNGIADELEKEDTATATTTYKIDEIKEFFNKVGLKPENKGGKRIIDVDGTEIDMIQAYLNYDERMDF